ncbi:MULTISPECIES: isochorismatase family protein [unclassified Amycolatopsis]|uniref:cysteine hydrolase family protein n=1 Tax=unclassified Amycolatopsis TaxID=2618356 RepID=UPI001C6959F1|nr:isochorismatase family protein [Amycolatopsis sp. DSM 110486]QYN19979.1 isochorismatase family protein [Amycolatopsis sp. DSM 110486]
MTVPKTAAAVFEDGWAPYLTDRDRAVLAATSWAKQAPFGLGSRPLVVAVDLYYAALGLPRAGIVESVADWPSSCGDAGWEVVDRTAPFLQAARDAGVRVAYFHATPPEYGRWNRKPAPALAPKPRAVDGNAIVAEVAPAEGDIVLRKIGPSCFFETPLDTILRAGGYDTLLVVGEATSGCVRSTVVDACSRGYRVGVVGDLCFDRFESSHWLSLFDLNQKYADVITADAATEYFQADTRRGAA